MTAESEIKISDTKTPARVGKIRRLHPCTCPQLVSLGFHFKRAENWHEFTPVEKINFELEGTKKLLKLIDVYNRNCSHGIQFRLREAEDGEIKNYRTLPSKREV